MNTTSLKIPFAPVQRRSPDSSTTLPGRAGGLARIVIQRQADTLRDLAALKRGLLDANAGIDPKFFYDPTGCALFDAICTLPEYYPTRTEAAIFESNRSAIVANLPASVQWIDLGCGSGAKSKPWIEAADARRFIGVDIAREWLQHAVQGVAGKFPDVESLGVVTDFSQEFAIHKIVAERPDLSPIFFYPGSSIGNFSRDAALTLLRSVRAHLAESGALLIGVDLVKDSPLLEAAYNDAQGVTAAFNRNVLRVVNQLLHANFDLSQFEHAAHFNHAESRIEMRLRCIAPQRVTIGSDVRTFDRGESILTEYSHKYTLHGFAELLAGAGFTQHTVWTDDDGWFAVFLASVR